MGMMVDRIERVFSKCLLSEYIGERDQEGEWY